MADGLLEQIIRAAVGQGVAPGIAFGVVGAKRPARTWYAGTHGPQGQGLGVSAESRFDLASLTKPLTTALWALRLADAGALALDQPVGAHLPEVRGPLAEASVWRLMNHTSGLAAHRHYYRGLGPAVLRGGRHEDAAAAIRRMVLGGGVDAPLGAREVYSDLGYLVLQWVCEAAAGVRLREAWRDLPGHGPSALHFRPLPDPPEDRAAYAATERCPWRGALIQGQVHDDNCWTLGGVGGHAGLFGRLGDVLDLVRRLLRCLQGDPDALGLAPATLNLALSSRWMHPQGTFVLGWDTPTPGGSTSGHHFGRRAFGHLGFTGTSIWVDPDADIGMVLLTNRVCPTRDNQRIRPLRPQLHDAAWAALVTECST